jgi:hypothetical protein
MIAFLICWCAVGGQRNQALWQHSFLHLIKCPTPGWPDAYVGAALIERVPCVPAALAHELFVGRLVNAGCPLVKLSRVFGHDNRTMKRWAAGLTCTDVEELARIVAVGGGRIG